MELMAFWRFIAEFDQAYDFHRKKVMKKYGLTAMEVDVLLFIANNPTLNTSADIVRFRKIAKSHVSLAVNSLSKKGYIRKYSDDNNRKRIHLEPTAEAEEVIAYGRAEQAEFAAVINHGTTEEDRKQFRQYMLQISRNLQEEYSLKEKSDRG